MGGMYLDDSVRMGGMYLDDSARNETGLTPNYNNQ